MYFTVNSKCILHNSINTPLQDETKSFGNMNAIPVHLRREKSVVAVKWQTETRLGINLLCLCHLGRAFRRDIQ